MGAAPSRQPVARPPGQAMRRQLLGLMGPTTDAATPSMRRALDSSYRSCRQSIETELRLGRGNAWSRRWRPFVDKYGPASAGGQAASVDTTELHTQMVRMVEECQIMKMKYGYQQYQMVNSAQYPHARPVRFASPLQHQKLPLLTPDLDHDDDRFYRRASHWKRQDLWRQMQQRRLIPVTPPSIEELRQDGDLPADSPLQIYGIDQVQTPVPQQSETSSPHATGAASGATSRRTAHRRADSDPEHHRTGTGTGTGTGTSTHEAPPARTPLRRLPLPDKIAVQQALR